MVVVVVVMVMLVSHARHVANIISHDLYEVRNKS